MENQTRIDIRATLLVCLQTTDEHIHTHALFVRAKYRPADATWQEAHTKLVASLREYRRLVHLWRRLYHNDPPGFRSPTVWTTIPGSSALKRQ